MYSNMFRCSQFWQQAAYLGVHLCTGWRHMLPRSAGRRPRYVPRDLESTPTATSQKFGRRAPRLLSSRRRGRLSPPRCCELPRPAPFGVLPRSSSSILATGWHRAAACCSPPVAPLCPQAAVPGLWPSAFLLLATGAALAEQQPLRRTRRLRRRGGAAAGHFAASGVSRHLSPTPALSWRSRPAAVSILLLCCVCLRLWQDASEGGEGGARVRREMDAPISCAAVAGGVGVTLLPTRVL
jgi:hypothetical protein